MAVTLDGRAVLPDGRWHGLTSRIDRSRMDLYRLQNDALIIGRNAVENDDPNLYPDAEPERIPVPVLPVRNHLPRSDLKMFHHQRRRPLLLVPQPLRAEAARIFGDLAEVAEMREGYGPLDILAHLSERGLKRALLEGGPTLNDPFFREDCVDRLYLTIVPYLIGQTALLGIVNGEAPIPDFERRHWDLVSSEAVGNELFLVYQRRR
jgi:riboflavin biosynthesis pyrimidine reductase